jgi:hypothetical protein
VAPSSDIALLLQEYDCPFPLAVVRMRFWGAINSPAARISPVKEIDALWRGKRIPFETTEEAEAFYNGIIGFWNALAQKRGAGTLVGLSPRTGLDTIEGLKAAMSSRHAELEEGFFAGFVGNLRPHDPVDPAIDRNIEKLTGAIEEIEGLLDAPIGPSNAGKVRSRFVALDKRAQKLIDQLVTQTRIAARGGALH